LTTHLRFALTLIPVAPMANVPCPMIAVRLSAVAEAVSKIFARKHARQAAPKTVMSCASVLLSPSRDVKISMNVIERIQLTIAWRLKSVSILKVDSSAETNVSSATHVIQMLLALLITQRLDSLVLATPVTTAMVWLQNLSQTKTRMVIKIKAVTNTLAVMVMKRKKS